jgi:acyl-CoA thioesterase I
MSIKYIVLTALLLIVGLFFVCRQSPVNNWQIKKNGKPEKLIFLGDSLTTGYGMDDPNLSYPNQLAKMLNLSNTVYGYNGITTEKALEVIDSLKSEKPAMVIVTLGGNDLLQRLKLEKTEANLREIFQKLQTMGHTVVFTEVLGIGGKSRHEVYRKVCRELGVTMVPDILKGMLTDQEAMQSDNIHPKAKGCEIIAKRVAEILKFVHGIER